MIPINNFIQIIRDARLATVLCSLLLVSCGDSFLSAGIGGTGISYGTVTGFGSIIVNGSHLDVSTATVTLDGNPGIGTNSGLKLGMVVKATGSFNGNTGTATSVEYRDNLEGEVCTTQTVEGITTLRVLGQTVIQDATTIVENGPILAGSIVEVSGLPDNLEEIHASFIEVKNPAPMEVEVKGLVDTVNIGTNVLTINQLEVNFNSALIDDNIPGKILKVGQFIEVRGQATDFTCGGGGAKDTLIATRVELEPEGAGAIPDGVNAEIEGFVTNIAQLPNSFMIGNRQVDITGSTRFLPEGFADSNIVVGTKVEAEGTSANGVLTATKISFRENVRLESDVASGDNSSFKLEGFPNIDITTNSATDDFGITITQGLHIRVRGIEGPNNTVLATRIDDKTGSTDIFLQGPVDGISGADVTILGVTVDTGSIFQFEDVDDLPISSATFLGLVQPGTLVKFKGDLLSGVTLIIWDEAELEDE